MLCLTICSEKGKNTEKKTVVEFFFKNKPSPLYKMSAYYSSNITYQKYNTATKLKPPLCSHRIDLGGS